MQMTYREMGHEVRAIISDARGLGYEDKLNSKLEKFLDECNKDAYATSELFFAAGSMDADAELGTFSQLPKHLVEQSAYGISEELENAFETLHYEAGLLRERANRGS